MCSVLALAGFVGCGKTPTTSTTKDVSDLSSSSSSKGRVLSSENLSAQQATRDPLEEGSKRRAVEAELDQLIAISSKKCTRGTVEVTSRNVSETHNNIDNLGNPVYGYFFSGTATVSCYAIATGDWSTVYNHGIPMTRAECELDVRNAAYEAQYVRSCQASAAGIATVTRTILSEVGRDGKLDGCKVQLDVHCESR